MDKKNCPKPHVNIGTIGHVDHGKTALTAAIIKLLASKDNTEVIDYLNSDNATEKKENGISLQKRR